MRNYLEFIRIIILMIKRQKEFEWYQKFKAIGYTFEGSNCNFHLCGVKFWRKGLSFYSLWKDYVTKGSKKEVKMLHPPLLPPTSHLPPSQPGVVKTQELHEDP